MIDLRTIIGGVIGAAIITGPAYLLGRSHGYDSAAGKALEQAVQADNTRRHIDAEISSRAAAGLCRSFGLRHDAIAECMRRVEQAHPASGNGGNHDHD